MPEEPEVTETPPVVEPAEPAAPIEPAEPQTISRDVLPVELRDQEPEKVEMYLAAMRQGLTTKQAEVDQLAAELAEARASAIPAHAVPDVVELPEKKSKEDLQQLILDDPEAALDYYAERKFGPALRQLGANAGEGVYASAYQRWPDFKDVEPVVRELIAQSKQSPTAGLIEGAYMVAQGRLRLEEKEQALAKASVSTKPSPPKLDESKPTLTRLEEDIAESMNMTKEEWVKYRSADMSEMTMEVPRG